MLKIHQSTLEREKDPLGELMRFPRPSPASKEGERHTSKGVGREERGGGNGGREFPRSQGE